MFKNQSAEPTVTPVKAVEADLAVDQVTFADLGLAPEILKALADIEHFVPTPIQAATIPLIIEGRDILGIARTGTGKTGGFLLPALHRIFATRTAKQGFRVLILSPTRELANQTFSAAMS
jgi:ATP-dependent RNA helicase RhlE